jgi:hypothetical protein
MHPICITGIDSPANYEQNAFRTSGNWNSNYQAVPPFAWNCTGFMRRQSVEFLKSQMTPIGANLILSA